MPGITTGSHLDRLLALRNRIDHEIAAERLRVATTGATTRLTPTTAPATPERQPVPTKVIRDWARSVGIPVGATGRLSPDIHDQYHQAHATTSTGDTRP